MAAARKSSTKTAATKKAKEVAIEPVSPVRATRRSTSVRAGQTAKKAISPSPSPSKTTKSKKAAPKKDKVTQKTQKQQEQEESDEEEEKISAVSTPSINSKVPVMSSSCSITKGSCCKKLVNGYLVIYNSLSAMAWAFLLFSLAKSFFADDLHNHQVLFAKTGLFLARLQTVALLEVLHAALGWVRSGVLSNVIQISSRLFVIWMAAVYSNTGHLWAYGMMATAWALSDFTRYAYYLTQLTGLSSPVLKWARYNFFLVLYPVGTLGEAILIFFAMKKWENLNPPLSYLLLAVLAIYTPGFLYMYSHMLLQRAKHFSPSDSSSHEASVSVAKKSSGRKSKRN